MLQLSPLAEGFFFFLFFFFFLGGEGKGGGEEAGHGEREPKQVGRQAGQGRAGKADGRTDGRTGRTGGLAVCLYIYIYMADNSPAFGIHIGRSTYREPYLHMYISGMYVCRTVVCTYVQYA